MTVILKDSDLYDKSKELLKSRIRELYKDKDGTYVISISRKGPKLLEYLFEDNPDLLMESNTLTEYGLPFLFHNLSKKKGGQFRFCLVDDAIYYGTTMKSLEKMIEVYRVVYGIQKSIIEKFAAIKDKDASPLLQDVHALDDLRGGYSHYFIKRLTSDIRSLHNTFEVEFPSVRFSFHNSFTADKLLSVLNSTFGKDKVYYIKHSESDNFNVLLPNVNGSLFNKLRIYADYNKKVLNVTCLTPRIIDNREADLEHLFYDTQLDFLWKEVLAESEVPDSSEALTNTFWGDNDIVKQDRNRCLVVLANFLLSFSTLIQQKRLLNQVFDNIDSKYKYDGISSHHIYYLVANRKLSVEIQDKLNELYQIGNIYSSSVTQSLNNQESVFFRLPEGMEEDDQTVLDNQNRIMVKNSRNIQEALSALSFNQTILVEKRLRRIGFYDFHRLHFGYTFKGLLADVRKYAPFVLDDNSEILLHKWVDRRIDQGCLVPQYVKTTDNYWLRVFRPGENEDGILSHLTRYASFVFNKIDLVLRLGWIPKDVYEEMLSITYNLFGTRLVETLGIPLKLEKNKLCFMNDDSEDYHEVVEYLVNMHILNITNDKVRISPRLVEEEMMLNTTLDYEMQDEVGQTIGNILDEYKKSKISLDQAFLIFNFYLYDVNNRDTIAKAMETLVEDTKNAIKNWSKNIDYNESLREKHWGIVYQDYVQITDYAFYSQFWLSSEKLELLSKDKDIQSNIASEQFRLNSLIMEIELLLSIFFINDEIFTESVLNEILRDKKSVPYAISSDIFEIAKNLVVDYSSFEYRVKFLNATSMNLTLLLNDE